MSSHPPWSVWQKIKALIIKWVLAFPHMTNNDTRDFNRVLYILQIIPNHKLCVHHTPHHNPNLSLWRKSQWDGLAHGVILVSQYGSQIATLWMRWLVRARSTTVHHGAPHGCVLGGPWHYYSSPRSVCGYVNKNWDPQMWHIPAAGRISAVYVRFW